MAYDEKLAAQVEAILADRPGLTQKRMFGGIAWLVNGNMSVVVQSGGALMVRVARADHDALLAEPGTATMVMRGRPLRGWITIAPEARADQAALDAWVERALTYAHTLPAK
jgi:TfoX/Sxy family transcriptional regulator of competence genes